MNPEFRRNTKDYTVADFTVSPEDFKIDDAHLDQESVNVVAIMIHYGELYAQAQAALSRAETAVKETYARIALEKRKTLEKPTENKIKEEVEHTPGYQAILTNYNDRKEEAIRATTWWKAIQQKVDLIKMLGYRANTEIKKGAY